MNRDQLAALLNEAVGVAAKRFARKHGRDPGDCESVANEAFLDAIDSFDPDRGMTPKGYVLSTVNRRLVDWLRQETGYRLKSAVRVGLLPRDRETGAAPPPPDRSAADPADAAAAREALAAGLPPPDAVAAKARALRAAVYAAVSERDVAAVVGAVVAKAKRGNVGAAKFVLGLAGVGPGAGRQPPESPAVIVNVRDVT